MKLVVINKLAHPESPSGGSTVKISSCTQREDHKGVLATTTATAAKTSFSSNGVAIIPIRFKCQM